MPRSKSDAHGADTADMEYGDDIAARLRQMVFPGNSAQFHGYIPANGTITLKYQLEIRRHPDLLCALGGETIRNEVFFGLTRINGVTVTEIDNTNNTSHADSR